MVSDLSVDDRVRAARLRIAQAAERSGRGPDEVGLVAVTKGVGTAAIAEAISAGIADIGENRVQEARDKHDRLPSGIRWHLLGHLQTNKARAAAGLFDVVHSLDSQRLARVLAGSGRGPAGPLRCLIEVDFSTVSGRTGVAEAEVEPLLRRCSEISGIHVAGLMTIAPPGGIDVARDCFHRLRQLRERLQAFVGTPLPELSMGMSGDFEAAVEEGATIVRIGRALFGERPPAAG